MPPYMPTAPQMQQQQPPTMSGPIGAPMMPAGSINPHMSGPMGTPLMGGPPPMSGPLGGPYMNGPPTMSGPLGSAPMGGMPSGPLGTTRRGTTPPPGGRKAGMSGKLGPPAAI